MTLIDKSAIIVRRACKSYEKDSRVLDGLNMTVPRGCIYGLLGASGCGKTTLLSCIVGAKKLDSGDIWVLGESNVPCNNIGYMPQDISLIEELSVMNVLYYFGRINGLEDHIIKTRYSLLTDLLDLPSSSNLVVNLSGGQQRRVSLAAALLHKPDLLVLDEPTVGLDPLLREKTWNYFFKLSSEEGIAIVITTHYVEETKFAHKIGLMRSGKLMAEAAPDKLLRKYQCQTIERVFLILSRKQEEEGQSSETVQENFEDRESDIELTVFENSDNKNIIENIGNEKSRKYPNDKGLILKQYRALLVKNWLQILRDRPGRVAVCIIPLIQVLVYLTCIGGDFRGLVVAVVNEEAGNCNFGRNLGKTIRSRQNKTCYYVNLSCTFLDGFDDSIATKKFYGSLKEAMADMKKGKVFATMHFPKNFSSALQKRRDNISILTDAQFRDSELDISIDTGDYQMWIYLKKHFTMRFFEVYEKIFTSCGYSKKLATYPIQFEKPIYGDFNRNYKYFVVNGYLATVGFFLGNMLTSTIINRDLKGGVWGRSIVQGIRISQILFSHLLTQCVMLLIQVSIELCVTFLYFEFSCKGSLLDVIILQYLTGFCGMCFGFFVSSYATSSTFSFIVGVGCLMCTMFIGGITWPVEGMPVILRHIALLLPTTRLGISLRGVMDKGFSIFNNSEVYGGLFVLFGWIAIFLLLSLYGLKLKSK